MNGGMNGGMSELMVGCRNHHRIFQRNDNYYFEHTTYINSNKTTKKASQLILYFSTFISFLIRFNGINNNKLQHTVNG